MDSPAIVPPTCARGRDDAHRQFVTVVSGLPRSGTSLMMRMLERGGLEVLVDGERGPDQDNPNGYYEFDRVKKLPDDTEWLDVATGKAVKLVYLLLDRLPPGRDYRVLLMERDVHEVVASQNAMLRHQGKPPGGLEPDQVAALFSAHLERVRGWLAGQPNFRVLSVNYNRLVVDPGPVVASVAAFLDGTVDRDAMRTVIDPALYRNRSTHPV